MLKCKTNTPRMGKRVVDAFKASRTVEDHPNVNSAFEHGQWWITCQCGAAFSVADCEGGDAVHGFGFEQLSDGEEGFHDDPYAAASDWMNVIPEFLEKAERRTAAPH